MYYQAVNRTVAGQTFEINRGSGQRAHPSIDNNSSFDLRRGQSGCRLRDEKATGNAVDVAVGGRESVLERNAVTGAAVHVESGEPRDIDVGTPALSVNVIETSGGGRRDEFASIVDVNNYSQSTNSSSGSAEKGRDSRKNVDVTKAADFSSAKSGSNRANSKLAGVGIQNKHRKSEVVVGQRMSKSKSLIRSVPKEAYIHVYRLDPNTTADMVSSYVKDVVEVDVISSEKLASKNSGIYSSFKLAVRKSDEENVLDPKHWPEGVHIRRFFQRKAAQDPVK